VSIYSKTILFITVVFVSIIIVAGTAQYTTMNHLHTIYNPKKVSEILIKSQKLIQIEYQRRVRKKEETSDIEKMSKEVGSSLLKLEEIDILQSELKFLISINSAVAPLFFLLTLIIITIYFFKKMVIPVQKLITAMNRYSSGNHQVFPITVQGTKELRLLLKTTNEMIEKTTEQEKKLSLQKTFLGWRNSAKEIVHEMKNHLTPAKLSVESAIEMAIDQGDSNMKRDLKRINLSLSSLEKMAKSLKELSNMSLPKPEAINLFDILKNSKNIFEKQFDNIKLSGDPVSIIGDKSAIDSAVNNIIINAIESLESTENGQIILKSGVAGNIIFIECSDNGSGIENELENKIFKMNFTTKKNGSGFGLFMVKKVAEDHSGSVFAGPGLNGKGTTIRICFNGKDFNC